MSERLCARTCACVCVCERAREIEVLYLHYNLSSALYKSN